MLCAVAALATGVSDPWRIGFVASFVSKLSDTVSSEIGKVRLLGQEPASHLSPRPALLYPRDPESVHCSIAWPRRKLQSCRAQNPSGADTDHSC